MMANVSLCGSRARGFVDTTDKPALSGSLGNREMACIAPQRPEQDF
jgi:hypothetical protein